jgi:hypothetical protein
MGRIKKFKRSEKTIQKQILIDGIESEVERDNRVFCDYDGHIYKSICGGVSEIRVQFPRSLRIKGVYYIADIYKRIAKSGKEFWSAYKGTIRNMKGEVIG